MIGIRIRKTPIFRTKYEGYDNQRGEITVSNLTKTDKAVKAAATKTDKELKPTTIKTNQSLVHIKHSITILQYKYWHLLLTFFNKQIEQNIEPDEDGFYYKSRSNFEEYLGYEVKTKELKADIEALRKEPIVINYLEKDGKPAIYGMGFISEYKITSTKIGFKLPTFIEKVIKGDEESKKLFLLLNWNIFNSFTGKYEAIIYKLCRDYVGVGRTPYFTVEEYRDYIGLSETEYSENSELNRWTIKKPILNINKSELSDISVGVEFKRVGRSFKGLYFTVKNKKQAVLPFEEFQPSSSKAFECAKVSISLENQTKYLEQYTEEEIEATIERANEYVDKLKASGKTVNIGAIYNKAFAQNWGEERLQEKLAKQQEEEKRQNELKRKAAAAKKQESKELNKVKVEEGLIEQFDLLPTEKKSEIVNFMLEKNKPSGQVYKALNNVYLEHGFHAHKHSPMFRGVLVAAMKAYNEEAKLLAYKEEKEQLILDFESLSPTERAEEIKTMLRLKKSNKAVYELLNDDFLNFGINAHKQSQVFYSYLVEHLVMSKIVQE